MTENNKRVIIFDMDGVLVDTSEVSTQYMMQQFPMMSEDDHKEILCGNFHEEIAKFKLANAAKQETPEEKLARQIAYAKIKLQCSLYDGIHDLVHKLHAEGYVQVVNTSAIERNCLPLLERTDLTRAFDLIATAEVSKSKIEKFKIIQEKYGVQKGGMLFVTDTLGDIREADEAGIPTVAVTWGAHDESHFNREPHENLKGIVSSVPELESFITNFLS